MRKESRLVVVLVTLLVVALYMVATHQDKGEYSNDSTWAKAQERFLSK